MIIKDNSIEYDTDYIDAAIAAGDKRDSIQRDVLSMFSRHSYYRYKQIREITKTKKCKHLTIEQVKERLDIEKVQRYLPLTDEEIRYHITFVAEHITLIK